MVAGCESIDITVGATEQDSVIYNKENLAIGIVIIDLVVSFYLWISLLIVRPLEKLVTQEIEEGNIDPVDFTVVVK